MHSLSTAYEESLRGAVWMKRSALGLVPGVQGTGAAVLELHPPALEMKT